MPRDLVHLLKASGIASPTTGHNFRDHVLGAASGVGMIDYNVHGYTGFTGDMPNDGIQVANGYTWNFNAGINRGSRASYIQQTTGQPTATVIGGLDGQEANVISRTWAGDKSSVDLSVQTLGKLVDTNRGIYAWYDGYTEPAYPPGSSSEYVRFEVTTSPAASLSYTEFDFLLQYQPDSGPYNPLISHTMSVAVNDRYELPSDYDTIEWHGNSSYTDLQGTGQGFTALCPYGGSVTLWCRVWRTEWGPGGWVNIGSLTFYDERGGL